MTGGKKLSKNVKQHSPMKKEVKQLTDEIQKLRGGDTEKDNKETRKQHWETQELTRFRGENDKKKSNRPKDAVRTVLEKP